MPFFDRVKLETSWTWIWFGILSVSSHPPTTYSLGSDLTAWPLTTMEEEGRRGQAKQPMENRVIIIIIMAGGSSSSSGILSSLPSIQKALLDLNWTGGGRQFVWRVTVDREGGPGQGLPPSTCLLLFVPVSFNHTLPPPMPYPPTLPTFYLPLYMPCPSHHLPLYSTYLITHLCCMCMPCIPYHLHNDMYLPVCHLPVLWHWHDWPAPPPLAFPQPTFTPCALLTMLYPSFISY